MSRAWSKGSTRQWRRTRAYVLRRDEWVCQLCRVPIDPALRPPDDGSASVHHLVGKRHGDDPAALVAAHRGCNLEAGDPERRDPAPISQTQWTTRP